jgi:protein-disulfide isomerase
MDLILLFARLTLSGVFAVSGVAKLLDLPGARQALREFSVPERLARPGAWLLPLFELTLAVLLLPATTAWLSASAGLGLLLVFTAGIGYQLAQGRRPTCHCFGQLSHRPIGRGTLVRNGALSLVAALIVMAGADNPGPSAVAWVGSLPLDTLLLSLAVVALAAVSAVQAWFLVHLLHQHGRLLARLEAGGRPVAAQASAPRAVGEEGLPINTPAPAVALTDLNGQPVTVSGVLVDQRPAVLLFVDPNCGPCNDLMPEAREWRQLHAHQFHLVAVSRGAPAANADKLKGLAHVWLQTDDQALRAYKISGTPSAVLVTADGRIASQVAGGADQIRALIATVTGQDWQAGAEPAGCACGGQGHGSADDAGVPIGTPVADFSLSTLDGTQFGREDLQGPGTLAVFWNPNCGFCRRMLAELKAWEAEADPRDPRALIVSTGSVEANQALALRSRIVLDGDFAFGRALGATGTPSAVLIDAEGRVASPLRVGADEVLALARSLRQPVRQEV